MASNLTFLPMGAEELRGFTSIDIKCMPAGSFSQPANRKTINPKMIGLDEMRRKRCFSLLLFIFLNTEKTVVEKIVKTCFAISPLTTGINILIIEKSSC